MSKGDMMSVDIIVSQDKNHYFVKDLKFQSAVHTVSMKEQFRCTGSLFYKMFQKLNNKKEKEVAVQQQKHYNYVKLAMLLGERDGILSLLPVTATLFTFVSVSELMQADKGRQCCVTLPYDAA